MGEEEPITQSFLLWNLGAQCGSNLLVHQNHLPHMKNAVPKSPSPNFHSIVLGIDIL
jgi:hypothetical protein